MGLDLLECFSFILFYFKYFIDGTKQHIGSLVTIINILFYLLL